MSCLGNAAHRGRRRSLAVLCTGIVIGFWLVAFAQTAQAHPSLLRSVPGDGQTVRAAPETIELWFIEPVDATTFRAEVYDGDGRTVVSVGSTKQGVPEAALSLLDQGRHVRLSRLPDLSPSVYEIRWSVTSKLDLHRIQGTVVFGFDRLAAASSRPVTPGAGALPGTAQTALGWADLFGIALMCGGLLLILGLVPWVRSRARPGTDLLNPVMQSVPLLVVCGGLISLVSATCLLVDQGQAAAGDDSTWALLVSSGHAARWAVRQAVVLAVVVLLARRARQNGTARHRWLDILLPVLIAVDVAVRATTSHAGRGVASAAVLAVHELAALTWVGGLGLLVVATVHLSGRPGGRPVARDLMAGFGLAAAICVALMVVTGLLLAGRQVATADAALRTTYGWALISKLVLVAVALSLGLRHTRSLHGWLRRRWNDPSTTAGPSPRSLAVETLVAFTVVALASVLAGTEPARGPEFSPPSPPSGLVSRQVDDMLITFALRPNRPGRNLLMVDVYDERRPSPGPVVAIRATAGAVPVKQLQPEVVTADGNGRWQTTVNLDYSDQLPFEVVVSREGLAATTVRGSWVMPSGLPQRAVLVSNKPLMPWTDAAAVAAAAIALLAAVGLARRRRRMQRSHRDVPPVPASPPLTPVGAVVMRQ
jgi:copper transport protein